MYRELDNSFEIDKLPSFSVVGVREGTSLYPILHKHYTVVDRLPFYKLVLKHKYLTYHEFKDVMCKRYGVGFMAIYTAVFDDLEIKSNIEVWKLFHGAYYFDLFNSVVAAHKGISYCTYDALILTSDLYRFYARQRFIAAASASKIVIVLGLNTKTDVLLNANDPHLLEFLKRWPSRAWEELPGGSSCT